METKKISKWDAAPESIKNTYELVNALYDPLPDERNPIIDALSKVLDDYNELEAKYNTDCGMISDYAEENAQLKLKNEKASNNIRELRQALAENDIVTCMDPITGSWGVGNAALQKKTEHFNIQLDNLRERLKITERSRDNWHAKWTELSDICSRNEDDYEMLQRMLEKDGYTVEYDDDIDDETVHCRCTSDDILKGTTPDEVTLQFGRWTLKRPQTFSEAEANAKIAELRARLTESEFDFMELKKDILFRSKGLCDICGWKANGKRKYKTIARLKEELAELRNNNESLQKENENLKQTLLNILETLETKVGLCRVHLLDSYEDRANIIAVEIDKLLIKCEKHKNGHTALQEKLNANGIGIFGTYDPGLKTWQWIVDTSAHDYRLKEKRSGRFPWGNEKQKYKRFDCPYLKDKYYNF